MTGSREGRGDNGGDVGDGQRSFRRLESVHSSVLLGAIFDSARDGIYVKDTRGRLVKVNRKMCEFLGVPETELIGKTPRDLFDEDLAEKSERSDRAVLDRRETVEEEVDLPSGGTKRTFSVVKVPLEDESGEILGLCAIVREVTARKWAERALRRSEQRLTTLMNNLPGMVYRCRSDRNWTMEFVSEGSRSLLGYPPEALVGNAEVSFGELVHPDDADRVWDAVQEALSAGEPFEIEYRVRTAAGATRWVSERGVGVQPDSGEQADRGNAVEPVIEGFIADVSRRVEADAALRRRLELESMVARIAADFVRVGLANLDRVIADALGQMARFTEADRAYVATLEGAEESINPSFIWCAPGVEQPQSKLGGRTFREFPWWRQLLLSDAPISLDDVNMVPEGAEPEAAYWSEIGAKAVLGVPLWHEENLLGYVVLHDVKAARRWREEDLALLRSLGPVLAHGLVRERTESEKRGLEHQLQHAQKVEAIGRLAGGVAHDFNNLLTAIGGYAELALESALGGASPVEDVREILRATERATSLTQQLLAFSRRQEHRPRRVDLNEVVAQAEKMLQRMIGEDVVLEVQLASNLRMVEMDPAQIDQLLLNLAVNARDAMPSGGTLTIRTGNVDLSQDFCAPRGGLEPGPYVMIVVQDTGIGMEQQTLERIFDPFFTTKDVGKGTGLGLSTVYGVIRQHHGWVDVYTSPGLGTGFTIYLPAAPSRGESVSGQTEHTASVERGAETVLVVEDDPAVRRLARQVLEGHGYVVLEAAGAEQALAMCTERSGEIDLVFSDVVMPGMSGRELCQAVHARQPGIKLLLTTGYDGGVPEDQSSDAPRIPVLRKPFSANDLLAAVRDVLDEPSGETSRDV